MEQPQEMNQVFNLTISDLTVALTSEMTSKNALAVKLTNANQTIETLQARVKELEALLDDQTQPAEGQ